MSDNEKNGAVAAAAAASDEKTGGMPESDVKFLVACLQNTTGGSISIDNNKVAEVLNFKNPKSVTNKIAAFKKKYDLPFGTSGKAATPSKPATPAKAAASRKASDTAGPNEPAVPTTPSKQRVSKPRNTSATKKTATPKKGGKKAKEDEDVIEQAVKDEDDVMGDTENLAVQDPQHQANYEAVFGKADTDEDGADADDEES